MSMQAPPPTIQAPNTEHDSDRWERQSAGYWVAQIAGHRVVAANHPHVYPRCWRVTIDGSGSVGFRTLRSAREWAHATLCVRSWKVASCQGHHFIALSITGTGRFTLWEALAECRALSGAS